MPELRPPPPCVSTEFDTFVIRLIRFLQVGLKHGSLSASNPRTFEKCTSIYSDMSSLTFANSLVAGSPSVSSARALAAAPAARPLAPTREERAVRQHRVA